MASESAGYYGRAWALLTKDKGWIKTILVAAIALWVPVAGILGVNGYVLEWARLTAWGVDSAPKQKNVQVGECIKSGWRAFVPTFVWVCVWGAVNYFISVLFNHLPIVELAVNVLGIFIGVAFMVNQIRVTIYQSMGAGFQPVVIANMIKADAKGFAKVAGIFTLMQLIIGIVFAIIVTVAIVPTIVSIGANAYDAYFYSYSDRMMMSHIISAITGLIPVILVVIYICCMGEVFSTMIAYTMAGLWVRQFNVPAWGDMHAPLPAVTPYQPVTSAPANPQQGYQPVAQDPAYPQSAQPAAQPAPTAQPAPAVQSNLAPEASESVETISLSGNASQHGEEGPSQQ